MTIIGYARVSTADQTTDPQESALRAAGAVRVLLHAKFRIQRALSVGSTEGFVDSS